MKNLLIAILLIATTSLAHSSFAQVRAVTEDGDSIYVYDDGTWTYELKSESEGNPYEELLHVNIQFDTVTTPFSTTKAADKVVVSKSDFFKIHYNSKIYKRIPPAQINEEAEMAFQSKETQGIFCAVISEEFEIGKEMIYKVAIENAKNGSGNPVTVIHKEIRTVNDSEVVHAIFEATFGEFKLTFIGNYYSGEDGTVQILAWTSSNVFDKYKQDMEDLVNGFERVQ